ncbi:unnamed protein product [Closterium sp. NIES-54]
MQPLWTAQDSPGTVRCCTRPLFLACHCYSRPPASALPVPRAVSFATVEDLVSHVRTSDARYRATVPTEFLDRNQPPMFITLYFIVTRLPGSLRSVRDHILSLDPTSLTVDLLEQHLLAGETSEVVVGAARGTPRPPFFEGCSPFPLAPSYASAASAYVSVAEDVGAASPSAKLHSSKGKGGKGGGGGSGGGGGGSGSSGGGSSGGGGGGGTGGGSGGSGGGSGGSSGSGGSGGSGTGGGGTGARRAGYGGGQSQQQQRQSETQSPQQLREWFLRGASGGSCPYTIGSERYRAYNDERLIWDLQWKGDVHKRMWQIPVLPWRKSGKAAAAASMEESVTGEEQQGVQGEELIGGSTAVKASATSGQANWETWHRRLAHVAVSTLEVMYKEKCVHGLQLQRDGAHYGSCEACMQNKFARFPFPRAEGSVKAPLEVVDMDLVCPMRTEGTGGVLYFLTMVDEWSRFTWARPLSKKSDAAAAIKEDWLPMVEWQAMRLVKLTCPGTPQQNGIAERANRTIGEAAKTLLGAAGMPYKFWPEAVCHVITVKNRVLTHVGDKHWVPYECWLGKKPSIDMLRVWGCMGLVMVPKEQRHKLEVAAVWAVHLGMAPESKGWLMWDSKSKRTLVSRDVKFVEDIMYKDWQQQQQQVQIGLRLQEIERSAVEEVQLHLEDLTGSELTGDHSGGGEQQVSGPAAEEELEDESARVDSPSQPEPAATAKVTKRSVQRGASPHGQQIATHVKRVAAAPSRLKYSRLGGPKQGAMAVQADEGEDEEMAFCFFTPSPGEPATVEETLSGPQKEEWKAAMDAEFNSLIENGTWELVELPEGRRPISSKWVFKVKSGADGALERFKSRLVAKGFEQKEKVGFGEIFAPVVKPVTLKTVLASAAVKGWHVKQMDITIAFLNGILLEDIYMAQADGYEDGTSRVCKLKKAIYGLKQAPRCWYEKLEEVLLSGGFKTSQADHSLTQKLLMDNFKCKMLGDVHYYLGLQIERDVERRWLKVHQSHYISSVMERYGVTRSRTVMTPFPAGFKLKKAAEENDVLEDEQRNEYQSLIGSVMYAAVVTEFRDNPASEQHVTTVERTENETRSTGGQVGLYHPPFEKCGLPGSSLQEGAKRVVDFETTNRRDFSTNVTGDCYQCVPPDPGIAAAALGASASGTFPGTAPAQALHTFTLDSGASHCFFRDSTTLTPLSTPIPVRLADPSGSPIMARSSTVLPCPVVPSDSLSILHPPTFSTNLVSTATLQDAIVTTTTPGGQRVMIYTCTWTGRHLATFTRRPGLSLYTLATEPSLVAASAQVSASGQVAASCSCRLLSHQTLLRHHRLGHPSLPRLHGMHSHLLVSRLPRSLPPLPPSRAPPCLPCVKGGQRAAPHSSSSPPTTNPLQTLHMDAKGQVVDVLIPWIRTVRLQLHERFGQDLTNLRPHSDRGGEFSSNLLQDFCRGEGILQLFTLPKSPLQNGIAERRIGLVMELARTSMIHAAAPYFLLPFAVQYATHQLNLWPRVSLPETSPTLRWTGEVGNASMFRVWGSRAFVRDTSADKLSPRAIPCVFLGFVPDVPGWQFYHPTLRRVFLSLHVTFDESVPFYRLFPYCSAPPPPPPLFLAPGPPIDPLPPQGPAPSGAAGGAASGGATSGGAEPGSAESGGCGFWVAEPQGAASSGVPTGGSPRLSLQQPCEWFVRCPRLRSGATGAGDARTLGAALTTGAAGTGGTAVTGPGGALTRGIGAARTGGVEGAGAGDPMKPGAAGAGGIGAGGAGAGGGGAAGAGAVDLGAGGAGDTVRPRPYLPASPLPAPSPYTEQSGGLTKRCEPACCLVSPVRTSRRIPRSRPPPIPGKHAMALRPSSIPLHVPLPAPSDSSLPEVPDPESDCARAASPTVVRLLATAVTNPSFESTATSDLVDELLEFAAACRLDYASALVADSESATPSSVGGECALGTDVLEDRQEDFECLASAVPRFASMLLAPEGDPDAPDIPTPRSYAEAIMGPYSSKWQAVMDAEMASWKSTGTYVDEVPPSRVNIVDGMWIFRAKRPPNSPPAFKARYVARGFSQRQGVDYFQTFSPTPKMTIFGTTFLQGSLHEEIWLRRPAGFTELIPAGTQWSLRRPVYDLRQAPREWHDTLMTTLAALGFAPATANPSLSLRTHTLLPPFYVLVYVNDLVFAIADIEFSSPQPTPLSTSHSLSAPPSDESVEPSGPYPELVGCLMYLMTCTRPDLAYPLSLLARYVAPGRHRKVHWDAAKRVLRYLCSMSGMGLVLGGRGPLVLTGHADASWVEDSATQRSSRGYTFSLGVLYVDNEAMIALCQEHRMEHRTKHIALRYFLARELQQRGQLRLAYVATRVNNADVLTKALMPGDHQRFATVLGLVPTLPHMLTA